ncbi:MAG: hypothetical protein ACOVK9_06945 [Bacteroidia bacterium]
MKTFNGVKNIFWFLFFYPYILFSFTSCCSEAEAEKAKVDCPEYKFSYHDKLLIPYKNIDTMSYLLNGNQIINYFKSNAVHGFEGAWDENVSSNCTKCRFKREYEYYNFSTNDSKYLMWFRFNLFPSAKGEKLLVQAFFNKAFYSFKDTSNFDFTYFETYDVLGKQYKNVVQWPNSRHDGNGKLYYDTIWYNNDFGFIKGRQYGNNLIELIGTK